MEVKTGFRKDLIGRKVKKQKCAFLRRAPRCTIVQTMHALRYMYMLQKTDPKTTKSKSHIRMLRSDSSILTQISRISNKTGEEMLNDLESMRGIGFEKEQVEKPTTKQIMIKMSTKFGEYEVTSFLRYYAVQSFSTIQVSKE
jgi:hypothetical protein